MVGDPDLFYMTIKIHKLSIHPMYIIAISVQQQVMQK